MATLFLDPQSQRIMYFSRSANDPVPTDILVISGDGKRTFSAGEPRSVEVDDILLPSGLHALNCSEYRYCADPGDTNTAIAHTLPLQRADKAHAPCGPIPGPENHGTAAVDAGRTIVARLGESGADVYLAVQLRCIQAQAALRGESEDLYPIVVARAQARGIGVLLAATDILEEVETIFEQISAAEAAVESANAGVSG